jgi:hypothetical protein
MKPAAAPIMSVLVAISLILASCDRMDDPSPNVQPAVALPAGLFLQSMPPDVRSITAAKEEAKEGERIAIRGRIGGTRDPFVNGRAVMTIVDLALPTCADKPDDCCETPWDYCCETRGDIVAHAATIQIRGENGGPLRADLKGAGGLQPMTEVIVVGTVVPTGSPTAFMIEAEGIYVVR